MCRPCAGSPDRFRTVLGRVPPSLLRNSDEQTVAGTAAVFTAMEAMGLSPSTLRILGGGGRDAIPGAGESGGRSAKL